MPTWMILQHVPAMIFVACIGAAIGSFLNVVVWRLPAGMGLITPPSRCPVCGRRLSFFRENLPVLGWFLVRGRCKSCGTRVSPRYMLVEVAFAALFLGLYVVLYLSPEIALLPPDVTGCGQDGKGLAVLQHKRQWPRPRGLGDNAIVQLQALIRHRRDSREQPIDQVVRRRMRWQRTRKKLGFFGAGGVARGLNRIC